MKSKLALALLLYVMPALGLAAAPPLVTTAWVAERLEDPGIVLVDMSSAPMQYERFHLPGAVHLPYRALVRKTRKGVALRVDDARLTQLLGALGITAETHVVVYDDMGGLDAARLFWDLERIGHTRVSLMDGGLVQWILEGRSVDAKAVRPSPVRYTPTGKGGRDNEVDLATVKRRIDDDGALLLDVRSEREYVGHPRQARTGHMPGARWWSWDQAVDFERGFASRPDDALRASLAEAGADDPGKPVVLYCQSGHRAARTYFTLRRLGFSDVRVYDGSMAEYAQDPRAPLVKGRNP